MLHEAELPVDHPIDPAYSQDFLGSGARHFVEKFRSAVRLREASARNDCYILRSGGGVRVAQDYRGRASVPSRAMLSVAWNRFAR